MARRTTGPSAQADSTRKRASGPSRFPGGGGSLRDPVAHEATLDATRELLVEIGFERLTVDKIAQRAGVAKPTIYRWWPNKAAVVHEAIWAPRRDLAADTGSLESDLRSYVSNVVEFFSRPEVVAAIPALVSQALGDRNGVAEMMDSYSRSSLLPLRSILQRARDRGELRDSVDAGMLADLVIGAMFSRILARAMRGQAPAMRQTDVDPLLDIIYRGVRQQDRGTPRRRPTTK